MPLQSAALNHCWRWCSEIDSTSPSRHTSDRALVLEDARPWLKPGKCFLVKNLLLLLSETVQFSHQKHSLISSEMKGTCHFPTWYSLNLAHPPLFFSLKCLFPTKVFFSSCGFGNLAIFAYLSLKKLSPTSLCVCVPYGFLRKHLLIDWLILLDFFGLTGT